MEIEKVVLAGMTSPSRSVVEPTRRIPAYADSLEHIEVSPDGEYLLSGGVGDARLFSIRTGAEVRRFCARETDRVVSLGFLTDDGVHGFMGTSDGLLRIYDVHVDGKIIARGRRRTEKGWEAYAIEQGDPKQVLRRSCAVAHGKQLLVGAGICGGYGVAFADDYEVVAWNWRRRRSEAIWRIGEKLPPDVIPEEDETDSPEIRKSMTACAMSPDGRWLAGACVRYEWFRSPWFRLGNIRCSYIVSDTVSGSTRYYHEDGFCCNDLAFTTDSQYVVVGGTSNYVEIHRVDDWADAHRIPAHIGKVNCLKIFPDGERAASAGHDGSINVYDLRTRTKKQTLHCGHSGLKAIAVSPCGSTIYSAGSQGTIGVFRL